MGVPWLSPQAGQQDKLGTAVKPELRPETTRVVGGSTPSHLHFCQIMDLRVIGAQGQLPHQCHQCLRGQEDWGIHAMADVCTGNQGPYEDQPASL